MEDKIRSLAARHLSKNWRISSDRNQWIVQRRAKRKDQRYWQPVGYIGSTKSVLIRVLSENKAVIDIHGQFELRKIPEIFREWREASFPQNLNYETETEAA